MEVFWELRFPITHENWLAPTPIITFSPHHLPTDSYRLCCVQNDRPIPAVTGFRQLSSLWSSIIRAIGLRARPGDVAAVPVLSDTDRDRCLSRFDVTSFRPPSERLHPVKSWLRTNPTFLPSEILHAYPSE